jgi:hypothetical protein
MSLLGLLTLSLKLEVRVLDSEGWLGLASGIIPAIWVRLNSTNNACK